MKDKKREYTVKYKKDGKNVSNTFTNITKAREFARECYRGGSFIAFHNINKIPLCI